MESILAIDIGGTKLRAGLVSDEGVLIQSKETSTPKTNDPEGVFAALEEIIRDVRNDSTIVCGVGCGGPMTLGGGEVSPVNIPAWRGFPLKKRISEIAGLPTFIDNDAKALALGEGWRGAARGEKNFLSMVVSTGVGGGIVLNGRLLEGATGNAGHIGHIIVEPKGHLCPCGARGCLEAEVSGPSILKITGKPPEETDTQTKERTGQLVGRAVASVFHLLDLKLAVVGGSVALGFGETFFSAAQKEIDADAKLSFAHGAKIIPTGLGDTGGLIGAAAVGLRGLGRLPNIG